jgi:hypothetical protein
MSFRPTQARLIRPYLKNEAKRKGREHNSGKYSDKALEV